MSKRKPASVLRACCNAHHSNQCGFALMELMIVIAVIGVLAVIAIPSFQNYQIKSNSSPLAAANKAIANLEWQEMAYSAPERMEIGSTSVVTVNLGGNKTFSELASLLEKTGQTGGQRVEVSDRMDAHLTGSGFEIIPVTPEESQLVSTMRVTTWQWQVKAADYGVQTLHLSLNARLVVDGKETATSVKTFEQEILVQVTSAAGRWAFIVRYWAYLATLLTAIIIPLIVFLWRLFTKANADKAASSSNHPE